MIRWLRRALCVLLLFLAGPAWLWLAGAIDIRAEWALATRDSAGIAPEPANTAQALVQVYAARAFRWRGLFAVHTWIATKERGARNYRVHDVIGWRGYYGRPVVDSRIDAPDRYWFGNPPTVIAELRGAAAAAAIRDIEQAVADYPHGDDYRVWPGPNSNTFTAFVLRRVPALRGSLPNLAIGKDYLVDGRFVAAAPSGTGYQWSLFGLLGVTLAQVEGVELNLLGLSLGLDPLDGAIALPGIGRLGG